MEIAIKNNIDEDVTGPLDIGVIELVQIDECGATSIVFCSKTMRGCSHLRRLSGSRERFCRHASLLFLRILKNYKLRL